MDSQRQLLIDAAWPVLQPWVSDRLEVARRRSALATVMTTRSSPTLAAALLADQVSRSDPQLARVLGASEVASYPSAPRFSRVRCTLALRHDGESERDALEQIAWGSLRRRRRVETWVDHVVAVENAFALDALGLVVHPMSGDLIVDLIETLVEVDRNGRVALRAIHVVVPLLSRHGLDPATLLECRRLLGAAADETLWVAVPETMVLDPAAAAAVDGQAVSRVARPEAEVPDAQIEGVMPSDTVVVTRIGVLDAVLHRGRDLTLMWDVTDQGIELVLEELVAVEVIDRPTAVLLKVT
jgi:hypothetical protein